MKKKENKKPKKKSKKNLEEKIIPSARKKDVQNKQTHTHTQHSNKQINPRKHTYNNTYHSIVSKLASDLSKTLELEHKFTLKNFFSMEQPNFSFKFF